MASIYIYAGLVAWAVELSQCHRGTRQGDHVTEYGHALRRLLLFIDLDFSFRLRSRYGRLFLPIRPHIFCLFIWLSLTILQRSFSLGGGLDSMASGRDSTCYNVIDDVSGGGTLTLAECV